MFLAPNYVFGGRAPEYLELYYKIEPGSEHVAKFHGDRLRDMGDYALKKKHHEQNIRPSDPYYRTGGLIMPVLLDAQALCLL